MPSESQTEHVHRVLFGRLCDFANKVGGGPRNSACVLMDAPTLICLLFQDDHIKIEELHKRRNHLAVFCKLVVYNVFPAKTAAEVIFSIETRTCIAYANQGIWMLIT